MQTNNEVVSRVVNGLNALTKDDHISRRFALSTAQSKAGFIMAQKLDEGTLFDTDAIFTYIPCFEMEPVNVVKCDIVEFRRCDSLVRSKKKLPKIVSGKFGSAIVGVTNLEDGKRFERTTPLKYITNKDIPNFNLYEKDKFYDKDGYLYLVNSTVEAVNLQILTFDEAEANRISGCKECDECKSMWDYTFKCPEKYTEAVVKDTISELFQTWRQIQPDENPNDDANQRTQTEA